MVRMENDQMDAAYNATIEQMRMAAGNAHHWITQVEQGFRPHMDGVDNTPAFLAHYRRQFAQSTAFLRAHAK